MAVRTARKQMQLDEQVITDPALQRLLERRQARKEEANEVHAKFAEVDKEAKVAILALDLKGPATCGRFAISVNRRPGRDVSFETKPSKVVRISPITPEEG